MLFEFYYLIVESLGYVERFLEFVNTLLAQISTRKFLTPLIEDVQLVTYCELSTLVSNNMIKHVQMLKYFLRYEVNDATGETGSIIDAHTKRVQSLQVPYNLHITHTYIYNRELRSNITVMN